MLNEDCVIIWRFRQGSLLPQAERVDLEPLTLDLIWVMPA